MSRKALFRYLLLLLITTGFTSESNAFTLKSEDISQNSQISDNHVLNGFGCNGKNVSPQISWKNPPKGIKSFAVTVYDPDAPTGSGWWHWVLVNIPAKYSGLSPNFGGEDKFLAKDGVTQVRNDFGYFRYGGPCPPQGDKPHRYVFTVYALKTEKLDLQDSSTNALVRFMINQNTLEKAELTAVYGR